MSRRSAPRACGAREARSARKNKNYRFSNHTSSHEKTKKTLGDIIIKKSTEIQLQEQIHHRKNGLGHKLMEAVHDYGRKSECSMATVATMSFQDAKAFYEKLGYVSDFERQGYTRGSSCIFLKRSL